MTAFINFPVVASPGLVLNDRSLPSRCRGPSVGRVSLRRATTVKTPRMVASVDDKAIVKEYFNKTGFDRWNRIYSETDDINKVQLDIRDGHAKTVSKILALIDADGDATGMTFADAGCGVGSLAIPLCERGAIVSASDISQAMVDEASARCHTALGNRAANCTFEVRDLEDLAGSYDTVCCIDVMIHYPSEKAAEMITHLASLSQRRLIISFAPKTFFLSILKKVGEFFPGPSKATRAYLHSEEDVIAALKRCGYSIHRSEFVATKFYFSRIFEAVRNE